MRTIRASEIGNYIFCQRAWWYSKKGIEPENTAELLAGSEIHRKHGQAAISIGCIQVLAYSLLIAAVVLVVAYITAKFL